MRLDKNLAKYYYTAAQARKRLGLDEQAFQYWIRKGRIKKVILPGREQGVYSRNAIDEMAQQIEATILVEQKDKIEFRKATIDDLEQEAELAHLVFGTKARALDKRRAFLEKNPDIDYHLYSEDKLVAYINIVPLKRQAIDNFMYGTIKAWDISTDDIEQFTPEKPLECLIIDMVTTPTAPPLERTTYGSKLLTGLLRTLIAMGSQGIEISKVYAASDTPTGIRILKNAGFQVMYEARKGRLSFELDLMKSDERLLREYKQTIERKKKQESKSKLRFLSSTSSDLWTRVENSRRIYGEEDTVSYERVLEWKELNNEIFMSVKEGDKLVGAVTIMPLDESTIHALINDTIREKDIPDWAIRKWEEPELSAYIPTIAIVPSGNEATDHERGAFLIKNTLRWAIDLNKKHDIKNWYAFAATDAGEELLQRLGFTPLEGERKGYKIDNVKNTKGLLKTLLDKIEEEEAGRLLSHQTEKDDIEV